MAPKLVTHFQQIPNPIPESNDFVQAETVSLPFGLSFFFLFLELFKQFEIDSRNKFKTPEEVKIYNNRESCRDEFFDLLREYSNSFTGLANFKKKVI